MDLRHIDFSKIDWEYPKDGVRQKIILKGDRKLRLVHFDDRFAEEDWCHNGHLGFIVNGEMKIDFCGQLKTYSKGDGLWIEKGESTKHKVIMEKGGHVEIILFEHA